MSCSNKSSLTCAPRNWKIVGPIPPTPIPTLHSRSYLICMSQPLYLCSDNNGNRARCSRDKRNAIT